MRYKVEKGVPFPGPLQTWRKYPFGDMEPGDSFFVPDVSRRQALQSSVSWYKRRHPREKLEFATRTAEENGVEGVRCWRVK